MDADGARGIGDPLLGAKGVKPLCPLYTVTFFQALAFCVAKLPALSLRFQEFAAFDDWEAADVATALGRMTALRSLLELFAAPILASWSDWVGRRPIMVLSYCALCVECALLASSRSLLTLSSAHIVFGLISDSSGTIETSCIADATDPGPARVIALGKLFTVVGAAVVVGPAIGGELAAMGGVMPLVAGGAMGCASLAFTLVLLPEYLPEQARRRRGAVAGTAGGSQRACAALGDFARLLARAPGLPWYVAASALVRFAGSAFAAVQALWAREALGWGGRDLGRLLSAQGFSMMFAQSTLLPALLKAVQGRESTLAQVCLLIEASRMVAYSIVPGGSWIYAASLATTAGACHSPLMRSLCSRSASETQQGLLSGGTTAVGTAAQVLGSLLGPSIFAVALRSGLPLSIPLFLSATCYALSALCVAKASRAVARKKFEGSMDAEPR